MITTTQEVSTQRVAAAAARRWDEVRTKVGPIRVVEGPRGVEEVSFSEASDPAPAGAVRERGLDAARQIAEYFAGKRRAFEVRLAPRGTPFQRAVWDATLGVGCGERVTYGEIARRIGKPRASRAVGAALGANPIPLIIPCHRVVASDGTMHGYSGRGGVRTKEWLLAMESGTE
jgi:methylated-DNA-[protein]-cysteine S-methyltransferase